MNLMNSRKVKAALTALAVAVATATMPAHASGSRIDDNGFFAQIVAWLNGGWSAEREGDKGFGVDPNG
jgi:hypothetical protein